MALESVFDSVRSFLKINFQKEDKRSRTVSIKCDLDV